MIYFIMYDIEDNRVRTHISKYLIKNGCQRVQKSIFLSESERKKFDEIHKTLREIQDLYENNDSIFFVPVSTDELRGMKIIGQKLDLDIFLSNKSTLIF